MKRMACVLALATGTGIVLGASSLPALADNTSSALASGLQLAIASPGTVVGESTINLDVTFRGGNIRSIELFVDGALVKKQVIRTRDPRGVISFALDGLSVGEHDILIKAVDQEGVTATTTSRLKIAPSIMDSLVRWQNLKPEEMVQGVVPIQIQVDRSIRNPYVTFLIDNDFLAFINLPPFTYNWDTSRMTNGDHTIGVEVYDGESLARVKTLSMKLKVNNPGGLTRIEKDPVKATPPKVGPGIVDGILAESAKLQADVAFTSQNTKMVRIGGEFVALPQQRMASIRGNQLKPTKQKGQPTLPDVLDVLPGARSGQMARTPLLSANPNTLRTARPSAFAAPPSLETRVVVTPGLPSVVSSFSGLTTLAATNPATEISRIALRPRRAGNIAAMPGTQLGGRIAGPAPQLASVPAFKTVKVAPKAGIKVANARPFEVAFDGQRLAFDVAPRVEKGMPLAPFRTIFEHTGGKVEWYQKSKTVRAINSQREIEFRVGKKDATVNNKPLQMEANSYVERGRTIVPLSFVRDALNVKVNYDAATGRLLIESNK